MAKHSFDLEGHFQQYLRRVGLTNLPKNSIQYQETQRAFMAGVTQTLVTMKDDISMLPENQAIKVLDSMFDQATNFWLKQNDKLN